MNLRCKTVVAVILVGFSQRHEYPNKFFRTIVGEIYVPVESRPQPGIGFYECFHLARITGEDHDEPGAVVFHAFEQSGDSLHAKIIPSGLSKRICLIYEKDATYRIVDHLVGLDGSLTDIFRNKSRPVRLYKMAFCKHAQIPVYPGDDTGNCCLPGSQ